MNEELNKLRRSVKMLEAKSASFKEGVDGLHNAFEVFSTDLDAFINVYNETQQRNEERLNRLEKHLGLS
ncbi:MAG: hypothetical protein WBA23_18415 [Tunicatimonas sp.]|uniref:hypothetical protein n=1 Tax=Tunicatimonas sp. TaxID=1940096 RepID=UPI003C77DBCE